jgi:putative oxidoreductase
MAKLSEYVFGIARAVIGLLFACHGAQKLFGVLGGQRVWGNPLLLAAGILEFFGGLLIALGLFARPVAFLLSGEMAVGYFRGHAPHGFFPIVNHGELAVLYCFIYLYIATRGAGPLSLDAAVRGKGK